MIKVLFLSQWYPHRYDSMAGLFVQKHAEAVGLYCEVEVLYVHAVEKLVEIEIDETKRENIHETIVYYPVNSTHLLHKFNKFVYYLKAYLAGIQHLKRKGFKPDIIHANILTRTGFIAWLISIYVGIPYIVTEHWSRYLPIRNSYHGAFRKIITKLVVKNAKAILPVSESLKKAMIAHKLHNSSYHVVNNVVDHYFFEEKIKELRTKKRIIHISCFDEAAKNVKGILRATLELSEKRQDFELVLIGTGIDFDEVYKYSVSIGLKDDTVRFLGEKTPEEVSEWLYNSDFFVLFSNYETAGVVIAESLVMGKPVITTNVGIAEDCINSDNGIIIQVGDENKLVLEMNNLLENIQFYNSQEIKKRAAEMFCYENIGRTIFEIYKTSIYNFN